MKEIIRYYLRKFRRILRIIFRKDYYTTIDCSLNNKNFGTEYGGWNIIINDIDADTIVFSFGLGEDISFDYDLIDNFELSKKENWLVKLFNNIVTKYRVRTAVISTILAAFIGFNLLPQVATKGVDFLDDSSAKNSNTYVYEVRLV